VSRRSRLKVRDGRAWYHAYASVATYRGDYPIQTLSCQRKLISLLKHFATIYSCRVAAFAVMGNHYHLVLEFEKRRPLGREELMKRALRLYPGQPRSVMTWSPEKWKRFENRLFDLSEFMRSMQSSFARWFNVAHRRRGRFWADRFKSTLLKSKGAVLDACIYVDLNGFRAGLVGRPEDWQPSSICHRSIRIGGWLVSLNELLEGYRTGDLRTYRSLLYHRGAVPTNSSHAKISRSVLAEESSRGFKQRGVFARRMRYLTDGVMVGTYEAVHRQLKRMRSAGEYLRRASPIESSVGHHAVLRPQRRRAVQLN
jgi:putative transposase